MFTGLIEETGKIKNIENISGGKRFTIEAHKVMDDITIDASIAVNGVCLTVVKFEEKVFFIEAVGETLQKTTLDKLKKDMTVNLERAVRLQDRLGGHLVQGHVNDQGRIVRLKQLGENWALDVEIPDKLNKYILLEGSIAIDGISLTIARLNKNITGINIIPHTYKNTNLQYLKNGDFVNLEVDILAKYVEKLLHYKSDDKLTYSKLKNLGY